MNTLVIIGNGFDLAHELPTKYSDFKNYLEIVKGNKRKIKLLKDIEKSL